MTTRAVGRRLLTAALTLTALSGCATSSTGSNAGEETLTVLAAASLTETFGVLGQEFERQHPGVDVRFSFDSSATLAEQAAQGAPADVLATADRATMDAAVSAGVTLATPTLFADNVLVLVTPPDNPADVSRLRDLPGSTYVMCVATAPCGKVAAAVLDDHQVTAAPASLEVDVKAVLAKVTSGEADAGLVYRTDQVAAGDRVDGFAISGAERYRTSYFVAPLDGSDAGTLATEWIELLVSESGRETLSRAGFGTP